MRLGQLAIARVIKHLIASRLVNARRPRLRFGNMLRSRRNDPVETLISVSLSDEKVRPDDIPPTWAGRTNSCRIDSPTGRR